MNIAAVYDAKTKAQPVAGHYNGSVLPAASAMPFGEQPSIPDTAWSLTEDAVIEPESTKAEGAAPTQEKAKK